MDHCFTEVFLNNKWIKTDSYCIDTLLFIQATQLLKEADREYGFGIHRDSVITWDGKNDAFCQYVPNASHGFKRKDFGIYQDINDFYDREKEANMIPNILTKYLVSFGLKLGRMKSDRVREGKIYSIKQRWIRNLVGDYTVW